MKDFIREWIDKNRERDDARQAECYAAEQMARARHAFEDHVMNLHLKEQEDER